TIRRFAFSSLSDLHARLNETFCRFGDNLDCVVFTSVPVHVLDELTDSEDRSLKITYIENNTATLIFRPLSDVHGAAKLWLQSKISNWPMEIDPRHQECVGFGGTTVTSVNARRQPDGGWGPLTAGEGDSRRRTLIIEVGYTQPHSGLMRKLDFWFDAGVVLVLVLEVPKARQWLTLQLWGQGPHPTRANRRHALVSSLAVWKDGTSLKDEGTDIVVPLAAVAARDERSTDSNLVITSNDLKDIAPKLWFLQ
ncbi:succinate dehydrogenase flavoprotein subunit, partial [Ascosphaera pollenicola]